MTDRAPLPPINFKALAEALLSRGLPLLSAWLPGGRQNGHEYVCGSLQGGEGSSCSINLNTGAWGDFATGEQGGDWVSLYGAIHGLTMSKAAIQVARDEGLEDVAGVQRSASHQRVERPPAPPAPPKKRDSEKWATVRPVPTNTPKPNFNHYHRKPEDLVHTAAYRVGDELHGYVCRFRTSDGGKDTLPYTWCVSERNGLLKWHWRQFDEPRPLFLPGGALPAGRTVVLVEGEVKGEVLQQLLDAGSASTYCVASWPGGSNAWEKADWSWLAGCTVLLWPDTDSKREKLTLTERKTIPDKLLQAELEANKPYLPPHKQPGMKAMLGIGARLVDAHGCTVQMLPISPPGEKVDGWDCRDAIETDGWKRDDVLAFFGQAQPLQRVNGDTDEPPDTSGAGGGGKNPREPLAEAGDSDDPFEAHLDFVCDTMKCKRWEVPITRKLIIAALRKAPALCQCLGFSELTNAPTTMKAWPWRDKAGAIADSDALRMGDWLSKNYGLKAASRAALDEAMETVADERRFHPVRDWLDSLTWDGRPRLDKWLMHVAQINPDAISTRQRRYFEMVGRFILMGHVARVMEPGCKFDYSVVLEGLTGRMKSTMVKVLVGKDFFSDTHFDIGNGKDGMEQLEGLWAYELAELTAFRKADSEQVKQFFSSTVDRFRGAYGKFVQPHPRQCVIWCTTNKRQYLYDLTGNRRFWPIWIEMPLRVEWLAKWRDQLFAEALHAYRLGERYYPTLDEEEEFFVPEQEKRLVETSVQGRLYELLTREGSSTGEVKTSSDINMHCTFVTLPMLVRALGTDEAKSSSLLENQIRGWLELQGWEYVRESTGARRRGYRQPNVWPPKPKDGDGPAEGPTTNEPQPGPAQAVGWSGDDDAPF
jgi:putative DNA primase/helicase